MSSVQDWLGTWLAEQALGLLQVNRLGETQAEVAEQHRSALRVRQGGAPQPAVLLCRPGRQVHRLRAAAACLENAPGQLRLGGSHRGLAVTPDSCLRSLGKDADHGATPSHPVQERTGSQRGAALLVTCGTPSSVPHSAVAMPAAYSPVPRGLPQRPGRSACCKRSPAWRQHMGARAT